MRPPPRFNAPSLPAPNQSLLRVWAQSSNRGQGGRAGGPVRRGLPASPLIDPGRSKRECRKSDSYYVALYDLIAARRGKKRAQVAVAHRLLVAIYHMLKDGTMHHDLGADCFEKRDRECLMRRAVSRLQHLGYRVSLEDLA